MSEIEQKMRIGNRRMFPRIPVNLVVHYKIENDRRSDSDLTYHGDVMDLSQGGMQFKTQDEVWPEAHLLFTIRDQDDNCLISGEAEVIVIRGQDDYQIVRAKFKEIILHEAA